MESQPQNPEFRNNPENFNPCRVPTPILTNLAIMVVLLAANVNAALASIKCV